MKNHALTILLCGCITLLSAGCGGKTDSESSAALPWSRVQEVQVTTEANGQETQFVAPGKGGIGPGASQSEVVQAWGIPDYIIDSQSDPDRKIWQYSHAVLVFQGTKVEKVLPR